MIVPQICGRWVCLCMLNRICCLTYVLGILLIELWTGKYPFQYSTPIDLVTEFESIDFNTILADMKSTPLRKLTRGLLALKTKDRLTCVDVLKSSWFVNYGFESDLARAHEVFGLSAVLIHV
jgi:hypothetical protein